MPRSRSSIAKKARTDWLGIKQIEPEVYFKNPELAREFFSECKSLKKRLEIEIGSGAGDFLLNASTARPESHFIGIEYAVRFIKLARDRIEEAPLKNVQLLYTDAKLFLKYVIPDESIDAIHVYFPDPWPKLSQTKRRMLATPWLKEITRALKPNGILYFASDFTPYAHFVDQNVARGVGLKCIHQEEVLKSENPDEKRRYYAAYDSTTHYGEKHLNGGKPISVRRFGKK